MIGTVLAKCECILKCIFYNNQPHARLVLVMIKAIYVPYWEKSYNEIMVM